MGASNFSLYYNFTTTLLLRRFLIFEQASIKTWKDLTFFERLCLLYDEQPDKCQIILSLPMYQETLVKSAILILGQKKIKKRQRRVKKKKRKKLVAEMNESDFMNNNSDNPSNNHQDGTKIVERYRRLNDLFDTIHYGDPITFDQLRRTMEMLGKSYSNFRLKMYAEEIKINSKKLIDRHHFIQLYHHLLDIQIKDGPAHLAAVKIQSILRRRLCLREQHKRN